MRRKNTSSPGTCEDLHLDNVHTHKIREGIEGIVDDAVNNVFNKITKSMDDVIDNITVVINSKPFATTSTLDGLPSVIRSPHCSLMSLNDSFTIQPLSPHDLSACDPSVINISPSPTVVDHTLSHAIDRSRSRLPLIRPISSKVNPKFKFPPCVFCKFNDHHSKHCHRVNSISDRMSTFNVEGRCTKCFHRLTGSHSTNCVDVPCKRGCVSDDNVPSHHCNWLCPRNPSLVF